MHLVPRKLCAQFSVCLALVIVVFLAVPSPGQIPQMGIPPFSTIQNGPDQVNLSDLSMHYKIPVFARPGRGIPFSFTINIDNIIWGPDSLGKWQFTNTLGDGWFSGLGAVFYSSTQKTCFWDADNPKHPYTEWRFNSFVDSSGAGHPFGLTVNNLNSSSGFCIPKSSATGISGDGAGVSMSVTYPLSATVTLANGDVIHAPLATVLTPGVLSITSTGPYTWTDSNGNRITENWNAGTLNFSNIVDTLGTIALSFSKTSNSQSFTYK